MTKFIAIIMAIVFTVGIGNTVFSGDNSSSLKTAMTGTLSSTIKIMSDATDNL